MSPIFENKRIILGNVKKESGKTFDITIGVLFMFLFMPLGNFTLWSLLLFPLGIFVGFYGPVGRSFKNNFLNNFDQTYNSISLEAAKMSKKKDLTSKEVDKSVNELVTESFNYEEVLDVIGFVDDSLNHKSYLKKKVKHAVPDNKVTLKKGEILYFRTHTIWAQGSPDNNVFKDIGYFYLSNKRFIFIGEYNSHSITLSRIVNFEIGNNYALICKTAGKNEIFEINKIESLSYLKFLYEKLI
jgi:hypothetical protein